MQLKLNFEMNEEFFNSIRENHLLAEDMSDEEIREEMEMFFQDLSNLNSFNIIIDNLDIFNY